MCVCVFVCVFVRVSARANVLVCVISCPVKYSFIGVLFFAVTESLLASKGMTYNWLAYYQLAVAISVLIKMYC